MAEYLTARKLEYRQSIVPEVWADITAYLVSDVTCEYGLPGQGPADRVADTGTFDFSLSNVSGIFTPGLSGSMMGWNKGAKVRYTLYYGEESWIKFYGSVDNIGIDGSDYGDRLATVNCVDWFNNANTFPLKGMDIETNKRMNEGVFDIIARMSNPPRGVEYHTGIDVFPTVFDSVTSRAKASTEFAKLAMSELGYIYKRASKTLGELLVVESRATRNTSVLSLLPILLANAGYFQLEQGGKKILMQGGFKKLHQTTSYAFDNNMSAIEIVNGEYILNDATVRVYPRKVDSGALANLFTLQKAMDIGIGETIVIRGNYTDATTKKPVNGTGFVNVATNVSYTLSAGAITINEDKFLGQAAVFGSDSFVLPIHNPGVAGIQVLTLIVKGYAIHFDDPLESYIQDADSIEKHDFHSTVIDQAYQDTLYDGLELAYAAVWRGARPRSIAKKITQLANQDVNSMSAFLNMDVGRLIKVDEDRSQVNGSYYISRVGWSISVSGMINYWFEIQEALSFSSIFWKVGTAGRTEVGNLIVGT